MLKDFDYFNSHTKSMESALKKRIDKQMDSHQTPAISFNSSRFGKLVLLFSVAETLFFSRCLLNWPYNDFCQCTCDI